MDWILHLPKITSSPDLSNYIANKHSTTLTSTWMPRCPHLNIPLISLFSCKQIQKAHWQRCNFFGLPHTFGGTAAAAGEEKKISIGFLSSIVASESLVERYNTPWQLLSLLNMLFLAHLCHRLSLLSAAGFSPTFGWTDTGFWSPMPGASWRIFKAYPIFKTWESTDMTTNLTAL